MCHPGCSKWLSSKAAANEEARRTLRYVEPVSDARTPLADFFSILLDDWGRRGAKSLPAWKFRMSPFYPTWDEKSSLSTFSPSIDL